VPDRQEGIEANEEIGVALEQVVHLSHEASDINPLLLESVHDRKKGPVNLWPVGKGPLHPLEVANGSFEHSRRSLLQLHVALLAVRKQLVGSLLARDATGLPHVVVVDFLFLLVCVCVCATTSLGQLPFLRHVSSLTSRKVGWVGSRLAQVFVPSFLLPLEKRRAKRREVPGSSLSSCPDDDGCWRGLVLERAAGQSV